MVLHRIELSTWKWFWIYTYNIWVKSREVFWNIARGVIFIFCSKCMHKLETNAYKSLIWIAWQITESYIDGIKIKHNWLEKDDKKVLSVIFDMFLLGLPWYYQNNTFWWQFAILLKQNMVFFNDYKFRLETTNVWNTIWIKYMLTNLEQFCPFLAFIIS